MNIREVRQILLIRNDKIGDLLLSTPFMHSLRKAIPWAKVTLVVSDYAREVLRGSYLVDELLSWEAKDTMAKIAQRQWDVAVSLAPTSEAYKMAYASKAVIRAGIVYAERPLVKFMAKKWLNRPLFFDLRQRLARRDKVPHEIEQFEQLAYHMGLANFDREMVLNLDPEKLAEVKHKIDKKALFFSGGVLGVQLAGRWINRDWKIPQLADLLIRLRHSFSDYLLTIFCGPQEDKMGKELYQRLKEKPGVMFFPTRSFAEWASAVKQMTLLIAPDCGGLHLASALKVPVAALYLPETYNLCSQQWAPWMVPHLKIKLRDYKNTSRELCTGVEGMLKMLKNKSEAVTER